LSFPQNTWAVLGCKSHNFVCVLAVKLSKMDAHNVPLRRSVVFKALLPA
jgi:hypothetical protein